MDDLAEVMDELQRLEMLKAVEEFDQWLWQTYGGWVVSVEPIKKPEPPMQHVA